MLFNSFSYLLFLPVVLAIYWLIPINLRKGFLLVASYFFYMSWKPAYGLLILALTVINYVFGLLIERSRTDKSEQINLKKATLPSLLVNPKLRIRPKHC